MAVFHIKSTYCVKFRVSSLFQQQLQYLLFSSFFCFLTGHLELQAGLRPGWASSRADSSNGYKIAAHLVLESVVICAAHGTDKHSVALIHNVVGVFTLKEWFMLKWSIADHKYSNVDDPPRAPVSQNILSSSCVLPSSSWAWAGRRHRGWHQWRCEELADVTAAGKRLIIFFALFNRDRH